MTPSQARPQRWQATVHGGTPAEVSRSLWWLLLLAAVIGGIAWTALNGEQAAALDPPPPCTSHRPQLVVPVLDVSDSVISHRGADRKGRAFAETVQLARLLHDHPCSPDDRLGAVIFANHSVEVPPIPLASLSVIEAAIRRPPAREVGGGTEMVPALATAASIVGRHPGHQSIVILLSDMEVADGAAVRSALRSLPATAVHLVALGDHDQTFDALFSTVTVLDDLRGGDVARALVGAVADTRTQRETS